LCFYGISTGFFWQKHRTTTARIRSKIPLEEIRITKAGLNCVLTGT
jgi:hypothetical protein